MTIIKKNFKIFKIMSITFDYMSKYRLIMTITIQNLDSMKIILMIFFLYTYIYILYTVQNSSSFPAIYYGV